MTSTSNHSGLEAYYPEKILKFCPRCGSNRFYAQGEASSSNCQDCNFHLFYNPATSTAGILRNAEGQVLLTLRAREPARGTWDLPGGFVSPLESAEDSMRREIKEELNLDIKALRYFVSLPNRYLFSGLVVFTIDLVFIADIDDASNIKAADDVADYRFFDPHTLPVEDVGLESMREAVRLYKDSPLSLI
jgi:NAD+ diphosphatase